MLDTDQKKKKKITQTTLTKEMIIINNNNSSLSTNAMIKPNQIFIQHLYIVQGEQRSKLCAHSSDKDNRLETNR